MKKNVYNVCIGLVIGAVLPLALILILVVADGIVVNVAYRYFHASAGFNTVWLSILLIPMVIISLFFLARSNKTLATAALLTAIISTVYVIYVMATTTPFAPS